MANTHDTPSPNDENQPKDWGMHGEFRYPDGSPGRHWAKIRRVIEHGMPKRFVEPREETIERSRNAAKEKLRVLGMTDDQFAAELLEQYSRTEALRSATIVPNPDFMESVAQNVGKFTALRQGLVAQLLELEEKQKTADPDKRKIFSVSINEVDHKLMKASVRLCISEFLFAGGVTLEQCIQKLDQDAMTMGYSREEIAEIYFNFVIERLDKKLLLTK